MTIMRPSYTRGSAAPAKAGMKQADVAESMGVAQASSALLEASAGSRKHAQSIAIASLRGCHWLRPVFVPDAQTQAFAQDARPCVTRNRHTST